MESESIRANLPRQLTDFIEKNTPDMELFQLQNDLSRRKYYRVIQDSDSFVIMDSILDPEQFSKFVLTTYFLEKQGFSVPHISQIDFESSIALIEDFGDNKVNRLFENYPNNQ